MERLSFGPGTRYSALESAHHLARYIFVRDLCRGRRVLDVACGEGYGSFLMAQWGAEYVVGIDISTIAVDNAARFFSKSNIHFIAGDCEKLDELVDLADFDLVVSFETLEHVADVAAYLNSLKSAVRPDGAIVISCPNDNWMYKYGGNNEFHRRQLTLQEFKTLTTDVLGHAGFWYRGTLAIGYSIVRADESAVSALEAGQETMLSYEEIGAAVFVPPQTESAALDEELAFYIGVWGQVEPVAKLFAGYPVSMELTRKPLFPLNGVWALKQDPIASPSDGTGPEPKSQPAIVIEPNKNLLIKLFDPESANGEIVESHADGESTPTTQAARACENSILSKFINKSEDNPFSEHRTSGSTVENPDGFKQKQDRQDAENSQFRMVTDERHEYISLLEIKLKYSEAEIENIKYKCLEAEKATVVIRELFDKQSTELRNKSIIAKAVRSENELLLKGIGHRDWLIEQNLEDLKKLTEEKSAIESEINVIKELVRNGKIEADSLRVRNKATKVENELLLRGIGRRDWLISENVKEIDRLRSIISEHEIRSISQINLIESNAKKLIEIEDDVDLYKERLALESRQLNEHRKFFQKVRKFIPKGILKTVSPIEGN